MAIKCIPAECDIYCQDFWCQKIHFPLYYVAGDCESFGTIYEAEQREQYLKKSVDKRLEPV